MKWRKGWNPLIKSLATMAVMVPAVTSLSALAAEYAAMHCSETTTLNRSECRQAVKLAKQSALFSNGVSLVGGFLISGSTLIVLIDGRIKTQKQQSRLDSFSNEELEQIVKDRENIQLAQEIAEEMST